MSVASDPSVLFHAKHQVPVARTRSVLRGDLLTRLGDGHATPLVLVTAPAGSGKSTVLEQWAEKDGRSFGWVTLDPGDNDPVVLVRYVVAALTTIGQLPDLLHAAVNRRSPDLTTSLLPHLGRAAAAMPEPFVLVLDDVHLLSDPGSLAVVDTLATHVPAGSQLVLSGRSAARLGIGGMRVRRDLVEIDHDALRMSITEADHLVRSAGLDLDTSDLDLLVERTEGWAAGLHLAALALSDGGGAAAVSTFSGRDRLVADYLRDELLHGLDPSLVDILLRFSVLDRLSGPLCDHVLERSGSAALLEELVRDGNLFVIPLDRGRRWYRFHHLFGELLADELTASAPEVAAGLRRRASAWWEDEGDIDTAIRYAIDAGDASDIERAADLAYLHSFHYTAHGRHATVRLWLDRFRSDDVARLPVLALAAAWSALGSDDPEETSHWVAVARAGAERTLPDGTPSVAAAASLLDAIVGAQGVAQVATDADAVRALGSGGGPGVPTATYLAGVARILMDDVAGGLPLLVEAEVTAGDNPPVRTLALAWQAVIDLERARSDRIAAAAASAAALSARAMDLADEHGLRDSHLVAVNSAVAAVVAAGAGDADTAREHIAVTRRGLATAGRIAPRAVVLGNVLGARAALAVGEVAAAALLVDEAATALPRERDATMLHRMFEETAAEVAAAASTAVGRADSPWALTGAELRVLVLLPTHLSLREIAERLYVSRNTVKTQAIAVYRKLGVSSRSEAVAEATRLGLLDP